MRSGGGGAHVYIRLSEIPPGGKRLAERPTSDPMKPKLLIETRGTGNYVVAPGSPAECHQSGRPYELISGDLSNVMPITTTADFESLLCLAREFDEMPVPEQHPNVSKSFTTGNRPGDCFNRDGNFEDMLQPKGFLKIRDEGGIIYWQKPNSSNAGHHITTNYNDSGLLRCFSSACHPFEGNKTYSKFQTYTLLNHNGDYKASAADLYNQGYGERKQQGHSSSRLDDIGNSERFVAQHGDKVRWVKQFKSWFVWNGKNWERDETERVKTFATETARSIYNEAAAASDNDQAGKLGAWAKVSGNLQKLKAMLELARPALAIVPDDLDKNNWLLNCTNGTIDLKTGHLLAHNPKNLITKICPVDYDPDALAPVWDKFLDQVFNNSPDLTDYIQKVVGLTVTGEQKEQSLFFCYGAGANGKSTFVNAIRWIIADYAQEAAPDTLLHRAERNATNDLARLKGARFVTSTETGEDKRLDENRIKQLTGGDRITARFLYAENFEFYPTHTLWLISNNKPIIRGQDHAIWRRVKLIPFEVTFKEGDRDYDLPEKLKAELPGILAWAVRGCLAWQKDGKLIEPDEVVLATAEYKVEMDNVQRFIGECCRIDATKEIKFMNLYSHYKNWCEQNNEYAVTSKKFGRRLTDLGYKSFHRSVGDYRVGITVASADGASFF